MIKTFRALLVSGRRAVAAPLAPRSGQSRFTAAVASPLQGELLSLEQLEAHARDLAREHRDVVVGRSWGDPLRVALDRDRAQIEAAQGALGDDVRKGLAVSPAAEWLLDNAYVIGEQLRAIRHDLPRGYYRELPKLRHGPLAGLPRCYAIAIELITHADGRVEAEKLLRFLVAYQAVTPLRMGELWALVIMLRVGLIQNLARLAARELQARAEREEATEWARRLLAPRADMAAILAELATAYQPMSVTLASHLLRHLRAYEGEYNLGPVVSWLEAAPSLPHTSVEELIHAEHQRQAGSQIAVGNSITSMRTIGALSWPEWFERVSLVEQVLRRDPAGVYGRSSFGTRDSYRHVVEELAQGAGLSEDEVARRAVARAAAAPGEGEPAGHIGYYLVDAGRPAFEAELGYRPPPLALARSLARRHPTALYLGALGATTVATVAAGVGLARRGLPAGAGGRAASVALAALPAVALATELVNRAVTRALEPRVLPRLDLAHGIPDELATLVVVPTLLLTTQSVERQLASLEVIALANDDPNLHFALLTDFADAPAADMPEDAELLATATERLRELAASHGPERFLLLHRRRVWNEAQGRWMGWERKRGKLEEFNELLAGAADTTYTAMLGDLAVLRRVRYVITLDADTQLPRDVGQTLIGTLAHPLNQARIDPATGLVARGYGILQPRVAIDLPSSTASHFARIFSGNVGLDPYTTAVSDVYMDLFGEGIYAGKGIYDPAALREALHERFPENTLLSHDLIEGLYARAGLLTDVEVVDSYPTTYAAWAARQHRWVRGDWQVAPWLLPTTPSGAGPRPNVLPPISRYKLLDNLRRSLTPIATMALLAAGWRWLPGRPRVWTSVALAHLMAPLAYDLVDAGTAALRSPRDLVALRERGRALALSGLRLVLNIAFLPDQSVVNLDAIGRTLYRMLVSRRRLLEWETAAQSQARLRASHRPVLRRTAAPLALAALVAALPGRRNGALAAALPVLLDWLAAPALAAWLDRPYSPQTRALSGDDLARLRRLARATWAYFERFVRAEANYLAPDNIQETPRLAIADRTSPTNIGLQLLVDLAAHDFGYIGLCELTARTERAMASVERLERHRGHLLNWYDTQTLRPLPPAYVSTVDSGNYLGSLITLRQGYLGLRGAPVVGPQVLAGIEDSLGLLVERGGGEAAARAAGAIRALLGTPPASVADYLALLRAVAKAAGPLDEVAAAAGWARGLSAQVLGIVDTIETLVPDELRAGPAPTLDELARRGVPDAADLVARHERIGDACAEQIAAMEFGFLYDENRHLFAIGYNLAEGRRDGSYYDLLASESRLGSFLAIATGQVPQEHWFRLGRPVVPIGLKAALLSWSGTMFEYLMPLIWMRRYPETLLDATYDAAVARQIAYAKGRGVPWGISESAFNARDLAMNYQYRAFGVPGLGMKPGLDEDLVIAPYATVLALPVRPAEAMDNLRTLADDGMLAAFGMYEAADYTARRLPPGQRRAIVQSFMAHHQGMSLLILANLLHDEIMQRRFHAAPLVQAAEPLLQERVPQTAPPQRTSEAARTPQVAFAAPPAPRQFTTPHTAVPYTHLLSNGRYSVMLTNAGGGYSSYDGLAVTRWRSDVARDQQGSFIYVRDTRSGAIWSTACQPTSHSPQGYQVTFGLDKVEYRQQVAGIDTRIEVVVAPEDQAELRRVTLTNLTAAPRELELTSYAEVVLATASADEAHPAFSNLFVETEYVGQHEALLATRRPRSATGRRLWAVHGTSMRGHALGAVQYESERVAFIGRGRSVREPQALQGPLAGGSGIVLDPILSMRRRVRIVPGGSAQVTFITGVAGTRDEALALVERLRDPAAVTRAFELAWTQSQVELRHLDVHVDQAHRFQRLATAAYYMDSRRRAKPDTIAANTKGQPGLWPFGISGDYPLLLVRVGPADDLTLVSELLRAHEYWRLKRLTVDLVILNEDSGGYAQGRQEQLLGLVRSSHGAALLNARGGIFVLRGDLVSEADRTLLETVACAILTARRGDLAQHLRRREPDLGQPRPVPALSQAEDMLPEPIETMLGSPYGGFTPDGREYVIDLRPGMATPAPWTNVVANQGFGFIVTEHGGGYTWAANSRENRLTPWSNDPVGDQPGEALYLRDEASGALWSPLRREANRGQIRVRHGFGYSSFERRHGAIASEVRLSAAADDPVKLVRVRLRNNGATTARLTATYYAEWVLGVFRAQMAPHVVTWYDEGLGALFARNAYNLEFGARVAFLAASETLQSHTGDRMEFIGRNGDLAQPAGLAADRLAGRSGAGYDPCGALRCEVELAPGATRELWFLLGQGDDQAHAEALVARYRAPAAAEGAHAEAIERWRELLGAVQVRTPEPALDVLLNGWLIYQALACRIWGRSAFYQSGGAYGFRDQLQDVMALAARAPALTRAQIVRAAARQFVEGDVQHWWHPPTGRGIRTRFSDDYLWLAFVTAHYLEVTEDAAVLDEVVPFLEGRALEEGEAEGYFEPTLSAQVGSIYEHCVRAIDYGLGRMGEHGLPLMGAGDWNDGMNLVGDGGKGESVWVAWFMLGVLRSFGELAAERGDTGRATRYRGAAEALLHAIEGHSWDGAWYLRAFYDDGTPMGSRASEECRIDSLTQSWAVITGGGDPERARQGMEAVDAQLVDHEAGLIRLFTPPFDTGAHDPGYIKGYVPGVRENGGQYTHAAIWVVWAWTQLGDGERAGELLRLINPVAHGANEPERYMVEPYVVAADVYSAPGHSGRGGWTWYTGSASWLYRLGVEQILGLRRRGAFFTVEPCLPGGWAGYEATLRFGATSYSVRVERTEGAGAVLVDGVAAEGGRVPIVEDGGRHEVVVRIGG